MRLTNALTDASFTQSARYSDTRCASFSFDAMVVLVRVVVKAEWAYTSSTVFTMLEIPSSDWEKSFAAAMSPIVTRNASCARSSRSFLESVLSFSAARNSGFSFALNLEFAAPRKLRRERSARSFATPAASRASSTSASAAAMPSSSSSRASRSRSAC